MKLRLTQPGFETYNGQMGVMFFEDGLTLADVLPQDAVRMAAVMLCEWENGASPSVAQSIIDNGNTAAPLFVTGEEGQHDGVNDKPLTQPPIDTAGASRYSIDQLAAIADAKGISGLREIATPLGIKSNSIQELINAILKHGATPAGS